MRGHHKGAGCAVEGCTAGEVADGVGCKGKTDDRNGRPDNDGRHKLIDPCNPCEFYNDCDDNIHKAGKNRAQNQAEEAELHGNAACKGREHGADESERRAEKHGAAEFGEQKVHKCADSCAHERGGRGQAVADDIRHGDGCRHNCQQLLHCKHEHLAELHGTVARVVFDIVYKLHFRYLPFCLKSEQSKKPYPHRIRQNCAKRQKSFLFRILPASRYRA